ncbi:MAG: serine/threonine protein kinase, partial [Acidobacteriota bacterium]|nr:serine/threonine protein kinase [Acidobacteriota bacterium]
MTPQRWSRIKEVFAAARETAAPDRPAYLESACGSDAGLRAEVERLLATDDAPSLRRPSPDLLESIAPQLAPGDTLAQYRVEAKLGQGGMGAVYRAFDTRLHRQVALKILSPEHFASPEFKRRLMREARAASALNHPNIVTVHEIGSENGVDFIAMELVEGKTLKEAIPAKGLPLAKTLDYAVEIAGALARLHACGIVHRDLKPGNIMLTKTGAKLLDFGLAKSAVSPVSALTLTSASPNAPVTEQGTVIGTFQYMSPEQVEGKELD